MWTSSRRVTLGATTASPLATARIAESRSARRSVLEQEAARPGPQRRVDVLVEVEGREDDDPRVAVRLDDQPGGLHTVHLRHAHVHQHDVGVQPLGGSRPPRDRCAASPRIVMSGWVSITIRNAIRISSWSSASSRLVVIAGHPRRRVQPQVHAPAALRSGAGFELASVARHTLSHAAQPASAGAVPRLPFARIGDLELDPSRPAAERQMRTGGPGGVLERVGQGLLSHPEHGQLDTVGKLVGISVAAPSSPGSRRHPRARAGRRAGRGSAAAPAAARRRTHRAARPAAGASRPAPRGRSPTRARVASAARSGEVSIA